MLAEGKGPTYIAKMLGKTKPLVKARMRSMQNAAMKRGPFTPGEVPVVLIVI